jgi:hypothetical protein
MHRIRDMEGWKNALQRTWKYPCFKEKVYDLIVDLTSAKEGKLSRKSRVLHAGLVQREAGSLGQYLSNHSTVSL